MNKQTTKRITYGELKNGMQIYICGHIFTVSKLETEKFDHDTLGNLREEPISVVRFTGTCTDDKHNDGIRNSIYNNGTYGGGANEECWITPTGDEK